MIQKVNELLKNGQIRIIKRTFKLLLRLLLIFFIGTCFFCCKAKQKVADSTILLEEQVKTENETESNIIKTPFSDLNYHTNNNFFRTVACGISPDISTAKKIAMINAKAELAGNIQTIVNTTTENYTLQRIIENKNEFKSKFSEFSSQLARQILVNVVTIGKQTYKNEDGKFTCWIAIEMNKNEVLRNLNEQISKESQIKTEYDKNQYENIFNKEMDKLILKK